MVMRDFTRRSWKKLFYLIAVFLVILTFAEANAKMKERNLELPKTVGTYTRSVSPQMVDAANIFDYMDGAGELYLAYRFKKLAVYKYAAGSGEFIEVEIYFMETPDDAFGLLSQDWGGESVDLGTSRPAEIKASRPALPRALYGAGLLRLWSGSIYARIMASRETPQSRKAVLTLGRVIAGNDKLSDEPRLLNTLSDEIAAGWKLRPNEIRYFRTHLVLNMFYYLSLENILNLDRSAEAVTATYEKTGSEKSIKARVLFVKYSTPEKASRALDLFRQSYIPDSVAAGAKAITSEEPAFFRVEDGWLGYRLKRENLALVFKCPDEESARVLITGIHFK
jgi:hypothetical protein